MSESLQDKRSGEQEKQICIYEKRILQNYRSGWGQGMHAHVCWMIDAKTPSWGLLCNAVLCNACIRIIYY